jgi:hypothetical protein
MAEKGRMTAAQVVDKVMGSEHVDVVHLVEVVPGHTIDEQRPHAVIRKRIHPQHPPAPVDPGSQRKLPADPTVRVSDVDRRVQLGRCRAQPSQ